VLQNKENCIPVEARYLPNGGPVEEVIVEKLRRNLQLLG